MPLVRRLRYRMPPMLGGVLTFNGAAEAGGAFAITGGSGNDTLSGGGDNDTITAGLGNDTLNGGNGDDNFTLVAA